MLKLVQFCVNTAERVYGRQLFMAVDAVRKETERLEAAHREVFQQLKDDHQRSLKETSLEGEKAQHKQAELGALIRERDREIVTLKNNIQNEAQLYEANLKATQLEKEKLQMQVDSDAGRRSQIYTDNHRQLSEKEATISELNQTLEKEREVQQSLNETIAKKQHQFDIQTKTVDSLNKEAVAQKIKITELTQTLDKERTIQQKLKEAIDEKQRLHDIQVKSAIEEKEHKMKLLLEQHASELYKCKQEMKITLAEERESKKSHEALANMIGDEIKQGMESMAELLKADKSQKVKGSEGERWVANYLHEHYGKHTIEKVDSKKNSADIKLTYKSKTILFEVRNYDGSVPKDKRDSLQRDVDTQEADGGILVSLRSGIVGMDDMELEITESRRVLVYLHNVISDPSKIKGAISMVIQASKNASTFNLDERSKCRAHLEAAQQCTRDIVRPLKELEQLQKQLHSTTTEHLRHLRTREEMSVDDLTKPALQEILARNGKRTSGRKEDLKNKVTDLKLSLEPPPKQSDQSPSS